MEEARIIAQSETLLMGQEGAQRIWGARRNFLITVVICMEEESFPSSKYQANLRAHPCAMTKRGLPGPMDHQWRQHLTSHSAVRFCVTEEWHRGRPQQLWVKGGQCQRKGQPLVIFCFSASSSKRANSKQETAREPEEITHQTTAYQVYLGIHSSSLRQAWWMGPVLWPTLVDS